MSSLNLIDFWCLQRKYRGLRTVVKDFHRKKAEVLEDMVMGRVPYPILLILEPPRMGKTDLGVKAFGSWATSYFPDSEWILGSNSQDLASENTKYIRDTFNAQWYRNLVRSDWGATVKAERKDGGGRMDYFHTTAGGAFKGVGMGAAVIGFGAGKLRPEFGGGIMIDDPIKPLDARSKTVRQTCVDWYDDSLRPRRNRQKFPITPTILVMQRLHPSDLAGYILSTYRRECKVIELPAYNEETGKSIWEDRISVDALMEMKQVDPELYQSQYQQRPSDAMTRIYHDDWWKYWNKPAEVEKRITLKIITADTAFKEKDSADWSVLQCWGFENTSAMYLMDQWRGKWEFPELITNAKEFLKKHTQRRWGITPVTEAWVEDKASGTSLVQTLQRAGLPFRQWLPPNADDAIYSKGHILAAPGKDKVARAQQTTYPIKCGRIFIPYPMMQGYRWVEGWIGEHGAFSKDDSHVHDDQVDGQTMASLIWQQRGGGTGPLPIWKNGMDKIVWPPNPEAERIAA